MRPGPPKVSIFEALRPKIVDRMLAARASRSDTESDANQSDSPLRRQLEAVLEHLGNYLVTGDLRMHRDFLQSFLAMRAAEAQSPSAVMASLTEIGDTAARVVQQDGPDDDERRHLVQALASATVTTVKVCNELLARDLQRKLALCNELRAEQDPRETIRTTGAEA
ncbi:MAG TPA: hypothetical protein PLF40_10485 [Kofleriaceae bacterium]|nr:hypothetical protein [Kofleriaceae bacterium]